MLSPAALEVLVSDGGGATRPHPAHPSLSSIGGRGLTIVEHLCSSWGVRGDERGTTVWAVLPAPRGGAENAGGPPSWPPAAARPGRPGQRRQPVLITLGDPLTWVMRNQPWKW
jgi:hypothetical protein